jgi:hypothetical protein
MGRDSPDGASSSWVAWFGQHALGLLRMWIARESHLSLWEFYSG